MNKMSELEKKSRRHSLLATSVAALVTMMISSSVTQASDIDVYQQAKSGTVTLMFLLDISGSMSRYNSNSPGYACDLPQGVSESGYGQATEAPLTGGPSYRRQWCLAVGSDRIYKFRSYKKKKTTYYQSCRDPQSDYTQCVWTAESTSAPKGIYDSNITSDSSIDGTYVYYYIGKEERFYDRITRLKDGMVDLLFGNPDKNVTRLGDDKIIGLSTLGAIDANDNIASTGAVLVPARRLDALVDGVLQRDILLEVVKKFQGRTNTPTARSYAETIAYLMGKNTNGANDKIGQLYFKLNNYNNYAKCIAWLSNGNCDSNSWDTWYNGTPPGTKGGSGYVAGYSGNFYTGMITTLTSGFKYSYDTTKNTDKTLYDPPSSFTQTDATKQCSGQGIYVLTDGYPTLDSEPLQLMQNALGSKGSTFSCDGSSWDCNHKMAKVLLDTALNPSGLKIKTAVVGFGSEFVSVDSFDPNKTQDQNIAALGTIDTDPKKAAYWGIIGEGGWYKGNNSKDVVWTLAGLVLWRCGTDRILLIIRLLI